LHNRPPIKKMVLSHHKPALCVSNFEVAKVR
jgi:hypothetical protein